MHLLESRPDEAILWFEKGRRAHPRRRFSALPSWRAKVQCSGRRRFTDGFLAHVRTPGGPTSPAQPLFPLTRSAPTPRLRPSLTQSNRRGTDPYARWWGRGGIARCPPIPIIDSRAAVRGARYRSACYPGRTFVPAWSPSPLTEPFAPSDRLARLSSELNGEQNVLVHVTSHRASSDRSPTLSLNKHGDTSGIGACF